MVGQANGWVAKVWHLGSDYMSTSSPYVNGDRKMLATNEQLAGWIEGR
jgi:hypothetical protein